MAQELKLIVQGDATGLVNAIDQSKKALGSLSPQINKATSSINQLKPASNQANFALLNLSRVAQDAPFGFIGIANNIEPLLTSFQSLKKETGSAKSALLALGSSLVGSGGLILLSGLATAALTLFGDKLFGIGGSANKAQDELSKFIKEVKQSQDILNEAAGSTDGEAQRIRALVDIVNNSNLSYKERNRALNELKSISETYFGNLSLEADKVQQNIALVDQYTDALIANATVKGFEQEIANTSVELSKQKSILADLKKQYDDVSGSGKTALTNLSQFGASYQSTVGLANVASDAENAYNNQVTAVKKLKTEYDRLITGIKGAQLEANKFDPLKPIKEAKGTEKEKVTKLNPQPDPNDIAKVEAQLLKNLEKLQTANLNKQIENARKAIEERIKLGSDFTQAEAAQFRLQQFNLYQLEQQRIDDSYEAEREKILKLGPETNKLVQQNLEQLRILYENAKLELRVKIGLDSSAIQSGVLNQLGGQKFDNKAFTSNLGDAIKASVPKDIEDIKERDRLITDQLEQSRAVIESGIEDSITGAADAIGNVLANGGGIGQALAAAGQVILKTLGGIFQQLGKQLIAAAIIVKGMKEALKTLFANPIAGLVVGVGLVALGGILKNIKLLQATPFADGGIVMGPRLGLVGEAGKEAIIPLNRIGEVLGSIGGSQNVFVTGQLSGETIYLQQQRVSQRRGRFV